MSPAHTDPHAQARFGDNRHFVRVNARHHWVVPKAPVRGFAFLAATGALVALAAWCGESNVNPFDLPGVAWLSLLIPVLIFFPRARRLARGAPSGRRAEAGRQ
jgi:hypothetical protein